MRTTVARAAAIGALVFAIAAVILGVVVSATQADHIAKGTVVVVGDPSTPGMGQVVHELQDRASRGDDLNASLGLSLEALVIAVIALLWLGVGAAIVWRQHGNWAGWLFLIIGSTFPLMMLSSSIVVPSLKGTGPLPITGIFAWVGEFALYPVALLPLLLLLYPDGHPPGHRWRWSVVCLLLGMLLVFVGFLFRPGPYNNWRDDGIVYANPFGMDGFAGAGAMIGVGALLTVVASISTAVAVILRHRRSTGEERQRMRLLAFVAGLAGVALATTVAVGIVGDALNLEQHETFPLFTILWVATMLIVFFGIPIAYLVAIFRYRLWDLDLVIKKTAVALVLTVLIGLVALVVIVLSTQIAWLIPGGWFIWLITVGAVALPFLRLSRRIARRIVFGKRATQQEVLAEFGERVGESYSVVDVLPRMVHILANATGARSVRVLLRVDEGLREVAGIGDPSGEEHVIPVSDQDVELGALAVTFPPNDPIDPTKRRLMENLAGQASLVLRNVKLIEELKASRKRLVAAQDEERRKLERNIHDGVQQQLVALQVQLGLARTMVDRDPVKAGEMLDALRGTSAEVLDDIRDLARGIYPPLLADRGLAQALEAQARKAALPVTVRPDGIGRYPQEIEATVYFCVLEALNNVAKYARASSATVGLARSDGCLRFTVSDDGGGFDPSHTGHGTGLQGIADRLAALGGALDVRSAPGEGTTVTGTIPVVGER